jgi:sec-independent protein translocase protein TatB
MFGVDTSELLVVAVLALLFIGPKELPRTMLTVGRWVGRMRGYARHFTAGIENVVREAELEEMERKWREENERIMRDYPAVPEGVAAEANPAAEARAYLADEDLHAPAAEHQPALPFEAPAAPDHDSLPPEQRPLP